MPTVANVANVQKDGDFSAPSCKSNLNVKMWIFEKDDAQKKLHGLHV